MDLKHLCILVYKTARIAYFSYFDLKSDMTFNHDHLYTCIVTWHSKSNILGGTADITVHQVDNDGTLRELHRATGGAWGGTKVDAAYEQFFIDIVGEEVWMEFRATNGGDYFDIFREFELKKRTVKADMQPRIVVKVPMSLRNLYDSKNTETFNDAVKNHEMYYQRISTISDKLKIDSELVKGFFRDRSTLKCKENLNRQLYFLFIQH